MKKFTAILLTVLMVASLFISCENNIVKGNDETVSVKFEQVASKSLTASLAEFKADNYYWAYKATKKDGTGLISGQIDFAWISKGEKGLSKKVPGFSQGAWEFTLYAYTEYDENNTLFSEKGLAYQGTNPSVTLTKESSNKVVVSVSPLSKGKGTLIVDTANISLKTTSTLEDAQLALFEKQIEVTDLAGGTKYHPVDGKYTLAAGAYKVNVTMYNKDSKVAYPGSVVATVYANMTTTVTGTVEEILTNAEFDTFVNPDVMNRKVTSSAFNKDVTDDIKLEGADAKVKATVPRAAAQKLLEEAVNTNNVTGADVNEMTLTLSVDTTKTGVTDDGKSTISYEIGLSSVLTSKASDNAVTQYAVPVVTLEDFVVAEIQLQKGLSEVTVTHDTKAMGKLKDATAIPDPKDEDGAYFYNQATGLLTIKTKTFSPFEVTYVIPETPYWGIGNGTEEDPYVIKSLESFKKLGSEEWQAVIEKGLNDDIYYRLDCDIDLSDEAPSPYFIKTFGGIFDGNGHTIKGNNGISFIFYYLIADTTIKNLNIDFDTESITRLWYQTAVKGTIQSGTNVNDRKVIYDKDAINITFENVDFTPKSKHSYFIGDNNAGIYQLNSPLFATAISNNVYSEFYICNTYKNGEPVTYTITLKDCDVDGNYNGGFGGSSAAVFFGGQLCEVGLVLENCSFNGVLEGLNVSLLMGNKANCKNSPVTLRNVTNNGTINSYTNKGSLYYGIDNPSIEGATIIYGEITGNKVNQVTPVLPLAKPEKNKAFDFTKIEGEAELKLFLPSVYTYEGETFIYQSNSNTVTIPVTKTTNDIYLAKVVSADDIIVDNSVLKDWNIVETATKEGIKYQFVDYNNEKYMVLNYGVSYSKFYTKDDKGAEVEPALMKNAMLLQRGTSNEIKAVSTLITLK